MKVYGIDLQKQYKKIIQEELVLIAKIKKRRDFLLKQTPVDILKQSGQTFSDTDDVAQLLNDIIIIEKTYVDQTKQLDLFGNK